MRNRLWFPPVAVALVAAAAAVTAPAPARADTLTAAADAAPSSNWAGYAATGTRFSKVSGTWTQPKANCGSGEGDAAFWVGLGGATQTSQALEQVGTEAACTRTSASYAAWYELVPAAPVELGLTVHPGDTISANVQVKGKRVSIWMKNRTTGRSITKKLTMSAPDTTSAEWIAEAPSACASGGCQTVPLTDFGTVTFKSATATAKGLTGPIDDQHWTATPMQLQPGVSAGFGGGRFRHGLGGRAYGDSTSTASAIPSTLTPSGKGFTVAWQSAGEAQQTIPPDQQQDPGYGSGPGYGPGW